MFAPFRGSLLSAMRAQQGISISTHSIPKRNLHFTIFIKGLPHTVTDKDLKATFESYGAIKSVNIFQVNDVNKQAMATIQFAQASSAMAAVDDMDDKVICGRRLTVDFNKIRVGAHQFGKRRVAY